MLSKHVATTIASFVLLSATITYAQTPPVGMGRVGVLYDGRPTSVQPEGFFSYFLHSIRSLLRASPIPRPAFRPYQPQ